MLMGMSYVCCMYYDTASICMRTLFVCNDRTVYMRDAHAEDITCEKCLMVSAFITKLLMKYFSS